MSKQHKTAHRSHSAISSLTFRATAQPLGHRTKYAYVIDGVSNRTVVNVAGYPLTDTSYDIATGSVLSQDLYANFDSYARPQQVTHLDGTVEQTYYACCGLDHTTDKDGLLTQYLYDGAKRQTAVQKVYNTSPITFTNILDAAGRTLKSIRIGTDGSQITTSQAQCDLAGEVLSETNALGGVTTRTRSNDPSTYGVTRTATFADGGTSTTYYYADGSLKKVIGTAVQPVRYEYGVELDGSVNRLYTKEIKLNTDGTDSSEWTKTYTDMAGRAYKTVFADGAYRQSYYNTIGQLWKQQDPDNVVTLYQYNAKGELEYTAVDVNHNDTIDLGGLDRVTRNVNDVTMTISNRRCVEVLNRVLR